MSEHATSRRTLRKHRTPEEQSPVEVPVVLPHLTVRVGEDDRVTVTVDGETLTPDPVDRTGLGGLLDGVLRSRRVPVRVEIIEHDGTTYTDVLTPPPADPDPEPETPADTHLELAAPAVPRLFEATGDGFIPGEDVALAVIIRHSSTNGAGQVRHVIEDLELAETGEVLLFGRISGTAHVIGGLG